MRLLVSFNDQKQGYLLSQYLKAQGIENQLDIITNTDWGSSEYGNSSSKVWVIDEDNVERAHQILNEFEADPSNPKFQDRKTLFITEPLQTTLKETKKVLDTPPPLVPPPEPMGPITMYSIILCVIIYIVAAFTGPKFVEPPKHVPLLPIYSAPIYKELYFDYPEKFVLEDQLIADYGVEKLKDPALLSPAGKTLYDKMMATHYWQGYYEDIVSYFSETPKPSKNTDAPLFEKIRQGEVWRLFTPALLHSDILHLFFNMIWLAVLGKQMEQRLGSVRYILFILVTGILCNIAQYFVSGANFLGYSGILCAMLAFIWVRQKRAAWEGYILQDSTMGFMLFFLITVAAIQIASFFMEIHGKNPLGLSIANTAHFTGLLLGFILGHLNFFSWTTAK